MELNHYTANYGTQKTALDKYLEYEKERKREQDAERQKLRGSIIYKEFFGLTKLKTLLERIVSWECSIYSKPAKDRDSIIDIVQDINSILNEFSILEKQCYFKISWEEAVSIDNDLGVIFSKKEEDFLGHKLPSRTDHTENLKYCERKAREKAKTPKVRNVKLHTVRDFSVAIEEKDYNDKT